MYLEISWQGCQCQLSQLCCPATKFWQLWKEINSQKWAKYGKIFEQTILVGNADNINPKDIFLSYNWTLLIYVCITSYKLSTTFFLISKESLFQTIYRKYRDSIITWKKSSTGEIKWHMYIAYVNLKVGNVWHTKDLSAVKTCFR